MKVCPKCQRNNSDTLQKCIYCGASLALSRQIQIDPEDIHKLAQDIFQQKESNSLEGKPIKLPKPVAPIEVELDDELPMLDDFALLDDESEDLLQDLRGVWGRLQSIEDRQVLSEELHRLSRLARQQAFALEEVHIQWPRNMYCLFVDPPNSPVFARHLVQILGLDGSAARTLSMATCPRIALKDRNAALIRVLTKRYIDSVGKAAVCIHRQDLDAIPNAQACLRCMPEGFWVGDGPIWKKPQLANQTALQLLVIKPLLVVVGTIEVQYFREQKKKKESSWQKGRSEKRRVIDLHHSNGIVRLIEQVTNFSGLPQFQAQANSLNCRHYIDRLAQFFPGTPIFQGHQALVSPKAIDETKQEEAVQSGWSNWEGYTRACRLLHMNTSPK